MLRLIPLVLLGATAAFSMDLTRAAVAVPEEVDGPRRKAVEALVEEVFQRSGVRWKVQSGMPADGVPAILVGRQVTREAPPSRPESYRIRTLERGGTPMVTIAGADDRGLLYGVGKFLRSLRIQPGRIELPEAVTLESAPETELRGHQLGYRPKTNSYDGFTVAMWEQYIRDLALWGVNAIELIPPRSDDADLSPHFPLPKMEMMIEMSRIIDSHGLDVWIWYPALDEDYSKPETVEFALEEWGDVFSKLPRVDAVFVPGGDPGHTQPRYLMPLLEKQTENLRKHHPHAQMWVAPQSFSAEWLEEFFGILDTEPEWLAGLVFGPQTRIGLPELRKRTPERYPIRRYPDITHSRHSQYPVPDWDYAFAVTQGREAINPRPEDQARIFRLLREHAVGFITYSEGVNDDVNKFVWSGLGWETQRPVDEILREYARWFIGPEFEDGFAQGLLALERNWRGPLAVNGGVETTMRQFQAMERAAPPGVKANWRFQQALFRAYYDAHVRARLLHETAAEEEAKARLREAARTGSLVAMAAAERALDRAVEAPVAQDLRQRVFELAEALFQSIRMQLSVERYQAIGIERGASLDTIDKHALNDRDFLRARFEEIRELESEDERLAEIAVVLDRTNPGPGGFYDDLGDPERQPHLLRGKGFWDDPAHLDSPLVGFAPRNNRGDERIARAPLAWRRHAEALNDAPLEMKYTGLDRSARYKVRVVYAGEQIVPRISLEARGREIHGLIERPVPFRPLEFDLPQEVTADGELTLTWRREPGLGGSGRGLQVAEVWLLRAE